MPRSIDALAFLALGIVSYVLENFLNMVRHHFLDAPDFFAGRAIDFLARSLLGI